MTKLEELKAAYAEAAFVRNLHHHSAIAAYDAADADYTAARDAYTAAVLNERNKRGNNE